MIHIYGRDNCKYCEAAVELLQEKGLDYIYHDIYSDDELLKFMQNRGHATVPQIYFRPSDSDEIHWGGYSDLKRRV